MKVYIKCMQYTRYRCHNNQPIDSYVFPVQFIVPHHRYILNSIHSTLVHVSRVLLEYGGVGDLSDAVGFEFGEG